VHGCNTHTCIQEEEKVAVGRDRQSGGRERERESGSIGEAGKCRKEEMTLEHKGRESA
jgi:hypothetical protein